MVPNELLCKYLTTTTQNMNIAIISLNETTANLATGLSLTPAFHLDRTSLFCRCVRLGEQRPLGRRLRRGQQFVRVEIAANK